MIWLELDCLKQNRTSKLTGLYLAKSVMIPFKSIWKTPNYCNRKKSLWNVWPESIACEYVFNVNFLLYIFLKIHKRYSRSFLTKASVGTYLNENKYLKVSLEIKSTQCRNPQIFSFLTYCHVAILPFLKNRKRHLISLLPKTFLWSYPLYLCEKKSFWK